MLETVTEKSLRKLDEILSLSIEPDEEGKLPVRLIAIQKDAAYAGLMVQTRVDENQLRKRSGDKMGVLLDRLKSVMKQTPKDVTPASAHPESDEPEASSPDSQRNEADGY